MLIDRLLLLLTGSSGDSTGIGKFAGSGIILEQDICNTDRDLGPHEVEILEEIAGAVDHWGRD